MGVPRSGLLAANMIALHSNLPVLTLDAFVNRDTNPSRLTHRPIPGRKQSGHRKQVLLVDDCIGTGRTFDLIEQDVVRSGVRADFDIHLLAIYATAEKARSIDCLEILDHPRTFEWNTMHHDYTASFCVDLDGVICEDQLSESGDIDADRRVLQTGKPKIIPSRGVGAVVTERAERHRAETERWLDQHGVHYRRLVMLNSSAAVGQKFSLAAKFKAQVYQEMGGRLFVESDMIQARAIFKMTGLPVYCSGTSTLLAR